MTTTVNLYDYFSERDIPEEFGREWLSSDVLAPLGIKADNYMADICEDILVGAADNSAGELHMRPGGWRINLGTSVVRTFVTSAVVGAGLFVAGADQIPLELLPAVLPLLVDLKQVRLNRQDRELFIPLQKAAAGLEGFALHPEVLYNRLEPVVRDRLNYGDYLAFTERLIEAGKLDNAGGNDIRPRRDTAWIRITLE
ncbi:hypothetical protein LN996_02630 [Arthrobacter sp. AK01]|uniref:hypothetical protein n=1 Tax=Arthrobacter sp. AK01 TaxID=2894084 RepID=UPI001E5FEDDE|nr:hypothetical protein [Arthrobacter sp. AK01]MCD4849702.1 hypothetical protein [Arthrobacter sp. AK01]